MTTLGGPRHPIKRITDDDLEENGGSYRLLAGAVPKVDGATLADAQAGNRALVGGAAQPIYVVTQAQVDAGEFKVQAGPAQPVYDAPETRGVRGHVAAPVYVVTEGWPPADAPDAPANLAATATGSDQIDLAWDAVAEADHYNVYRATAGSGPFTRVDTSGTNSYSDTGLSASTQYWYYVTAVTGASESAASNMDSDTTGASGPSFVDATSATVPDAGSLAITTPAAASAGDIMIAALTYTRLTVGDMTAPAGWTKIARANASVYAYLITFWREHAGGSEPASHTFSDAYTGFGVAGGIAAYSGIDTTTPVEDSGTVGEDTDAGTIVAPSVTAGGADRILVCTYGTRDLAAGITHTPEAGSERWDVHTGASQDLTAMLVDEAVGSGATGTRTDTLSENALRRVGISMLLQPA